MVGKRCKPRMSLWLFELRDPLALLVRIPTPRNFDRSSLGARDFPGRCQCHDVSVLSSQFPIQGSDCIDDRNVKIFHITSSLSTPFHTGMPLSMRPLLMVV